MTYRCQNSRKNNFATELVFLMHDWELGPEPSAGIGRIGVAQWRQACASGGEAALAAKPMPGRPRQLTDQQGQQWLQLLLKGARAYGFPKAIVDNPDQGRVHGIAGESSRVIELRVAKEDIGKVIGKHGRTITAMRTILNATRAQKDKRHVLEVLD